MRRRGDAAAALVSRVDSGRRTRREALRGRLAVFAAALGEAPSPGRTTIDLVEQAIRVLRPIDGRPDPSKIWLLHAVLAARFPAPDMIVQATRRARLDGPEAAIALALDHALDRSLNIAPDAVLSQEIPDDMGWPQVEVVTGEIIVDLHHTARTRLATGIQRVARESARRWSRDHDPVFVQWGGRGTSMHRLTTAEVAAALSGEGMSDDADPADPTVLIPWNCRYLLPEVAVERNRVRALTAMLRFSGTTGGSIGFDCVPMTSNETVNIEVGGFFAYGMSVTRHLDRVATISEGAGVEYAGWRTILSGTGVEGPEIRAVPLAVEARKATPEARAQVAEELGLPSIPMVLVVGSHEPRKNHLAVLHAAELLWRKGYRFHVVFVGGQSWRSDEVRGRVAELRAGGRLVDSVTALPDDQLWAAYEMADVVLFPSLNEGFGLPVAEALATGTPVITSRFGPMAEIAAHGGALFVDPRDDHDLAEALARFLDDPDLRARLRAEAERSPTRTWDDYAAEVWAYLAADAAR